MSFPPFLSNQQFVLTSGTTADAYKAEITLVRIEEYLRKAEFGKSLTQTLARLEAYSTVRVDGLRPSVNEIVALDVFGETLETSILEHRWLKSDFCSRESSLEAFRYLEALRWIAQTVHEDFAFTPEFILDVHSRCVFGIPAKESGIRFRQKEWGGASDDLASAPQRFQVPPASMLSDYIEDLCRFMNAQKYSPIMQAGIMHFQFESIKPFKSALDRTGRALCHAIFFSRGLLRGTIAPIALLPAIDTLDHARHLLPYQFGDEMDQRGRLQAVGSWAGYCAHAAGVAADVIEKYIAAFEQAQRDWQALLGKVSKGSALESILNALPGYPILTVEFACRYTGKGISACNDAIGKLHKAGVLTLMDNPFNNSRLFKADRALSIIDGINQALLAGTPVSRNSLAGL